MKFVLQKIGTVVFFCAWPAFYFYLRRSVRSRILLVSGQDVLVVKNWISDGKWSLPGGGLHPGEPLVPGALRELHEETGLTLPPDRLQHIGETMYHRYGHSFPFHIFVVPTAKVALRKQRVEISDMRWMAVDKLTARNASSDLLQSLEAARTSGHLLQ